MLVAHAHGVVAAVGRQRFRAGTRAATPTSLLAPELAGGSLVFSAFSTECCQRRAWIEPHRIRRRHRTSDACFSGRPSATDASNGSGYALSSPGTDDKFVAEYLAKYRATIAPRCAGNTPSDATAIERVRPERFEHSSCQAVSEHGHGSRGRKFHRQSW